MKFNDIPTNPGPENPELTAYENESKRIDLGLKKAKLIKELSITTPTEKKESHISIKKTLGGIGVIIVYFLSVYAVITDSSLIGVVLSVDVALIAALFGLKLMGGYFKNTGGK